jgi:hypothetical protein
MSYERLWLITLTAVVAAAYVPAVQRLFAERSVAGIPGFVFLLLLQTGLVLVLFVIAAARASKYR